MIYFVPKIQSIDANKTILNDLGMSQLGKVALQWGHIDRGPEGAPGVIFKRAEYQGKLRYSDCGTWRKCAGGKYWIGFEERPKPHELERSNMISGYRVELSDGEQWVLPVASALPSYWGLDDDDRRVKRMRPEHKTLSEYADRCYSIWESQNGLRQPVPDLTDDEKYQIGVAALSANYHVGPYELDLLQVPNDNDVVLASLTLIDAPNLKIDDADEIKKKPDELCG